MAHDHLIDDLTVWRALHTAVLAQAVSDFRAITEAGLLDDAGNLPAPGTVNHRVKLVGMSSARELIDLHRFLTTSELERWLQLDFEDLGSDNLTPLANQIRKQLNIRQILHENSR